MTNKLSPSGKSEGVIIVGNRTGLEKLRDAINLTLEKGNTKNTFWPNDYESYHLFMACMSEDDFEGWNGDSTATLYSFQMMSRYFS